MTPSGSTCFKLAQLGLIASLAFSALPAFGQSVARLGEFKKWTAYTAIESGSKICFMYANPERASAGEEGAKPSAFFYVTQRPGEKLRNEVSYISGYIFQTDSLADVQIGSTSFSFFTKEDGAWIEDVATSEQFVAAMRRGNTMTIDGTDSRGVKIQHIFSLSGATAGSRAIRNACP